MMGMFYGIDIADLSIIAILADVSNIARKITSSFLLSLLFSRSR